MRTGKTSRSWRFSYLLLLFIISLAVCTVLLYSKVIAHSREVLRFEVRHSADHLISQAVDRALKDEHQDCLSVQRAADGSVTFAETDTAQLNALENRLKTEINDALSKLSDSEITVPVGTLTGFAPLVGKGFDVRVGLEQYGTADVKLSGNFTTAGVNQTHFSLRLDINAEILAVVGRQPQTVEVTDEYVVSDTVIVGNPLFGQ